MWIYCNKKDKPKMFSGQLYLRNCERLSLIVWLHKRKFLVECCKFAASLILEQRWLILDMKLSSHCHNPTCLQKRALSVHILDGDRKDLYKWNWQNIKNKEINIGHFQNFTTPERKPKFWLEKLCMTKTSKLFDFLTCAVKMSKMLAFKMTYCTFLTTQNKLFT